MVIYQIINFKLENEIIMKKKPYIGEMKVQESPGHSAQSNLGRNDSSPLRNTRRAQQISSLHQQFEDLKKKIKEVENKNEKIIQKIHKAFSFKKKGAGVYTEEYISNSEHLKQPIVYFENNYLEGIANQSHNPSIADEKSNHSDQSQYDYRMKKQPIPNDIPRKSIQPKKNFKNTLNFNMSMQYAKDSSLSNHQVEVERQVSQKVSIKTPNPALVNRKSNYSNNSKFTANKSLYDIKLTQLEQSLNYEKERVMGLNKQIQQKSSQIYMLQNSKEKFRGYSESAIIIFENTFLDDFVQRKVSEMQRSLKRNEIKIQNLFRFIQNYKQEKIDLKQFESRVKKLDYKKSKESQRMSQEVGRERRRRSDLSKSKSKLNDKSAIEKNKKNAQFQQISDKYQQMIKNRNQQLEKIDKKYKKKQKEYLELKTQNDNLQKRIIELTDNINTKYSQDRLNSIRKSNTQSSNQSNLMDSFKLSQSQFTIQALKKQLLEKNSKISQLVASIEIYEDKNSMLHSQYQENLARNRLSKNKNLQELQVKINTLQKQIKKKQTIIAQFNQKVSQFEKNFLEKQCQLYGITSKVQNCQRILEMKNKKIQELQKLLVYTEDQLQRNSLTESDPNFVSGTSKLKQQIQNLQKQLEIKRIEITKINKTREQDKNKIKKLEEKIKQITLENQKMKQENLLINNLIKQQSENLLQSQKSNDEFIEKDRLQEELNQRNVKNNQLSLINHNLKAQNLQLNSKILQMQGQLDFIMNEQSEKDKTIDKYKKQVQIISSKQNQLKNLLIQRQTELQFQRKQNQQRIQEIQKQWKQFQSERLLMIPQKSEKSTIKNEKLNQNSLATQNQYLTQKLKDAQSTIEMLNLMEKKIIQQYQNNLDKIRNQIKEKTITLQKANLEIQKLKRKLSNQEKLYNQELKQKNTQNNKQDNIKSQNYLGIEQIYNEYQNQNYNSIDPNQENDKQQPFSNIKKDQLFLTIEEKNQQLQNQLRQAKDINNKLTQMSNQLFAQIKSKEQQKIDILRMLQNRNMRVQQLEDLLQLKQMNFGSNISSKSKQKQSMRSQSSLRYSAASQLKNDTIQIDLSEAGSSFFDNNYIENVSEIFQKQQFPYQKIKLKRKEQIKLFQKTSSYIKTLKQAIEQKNKKIRILQKKIDSLRSSELVRKDYDFHHQKNTTQNEEYDDDTFKDYQSAQLQYKRGGSHQRYKVLEHQTKLIIEQNNMLTHQIQNLHQELIKAEEQENSLVKIKDLYKEQIKKVIKKNQQLTKSFQDEIQRYRQKIQDSQSVHNLEAIKQLFVKLVASFNAMEQEQKGRKKQQKKKQVQEYVKVMCSILKIQNSIKDKLIMSIRN